MPRPKYGLGHGLEALVSPGLSQSTLRGGPAEESATGGDAESDAVPRLRWEYARLSVRKRKKKKRKLTLLVSHPDARVKPRSQHVRGTGLWTAIGVLGCDGWELIAINRRCWYFKRSLG